MSRRAVRQRSPAPSAGILPLVVSVVAFAGLAAAVWYAGPLLGPGDQRPLSSAGARVALIALVAVVVAGYYLRQQLLASRAQRAMATAMSSGAQGTDAALLEKGMQDALAALSRSGGRRNFLYEVPWHLIIGPPGAGKTTAIANSGLPFPLAVSGAAQSVPGIGGTRNCDWWFTDRGVLLDTAGRYTTQDTDADRDRKGWLEFLALLKKHRGVQPINGVIVAVSVADLLTSGQRELDVLATEIRNRLGELHERLKIDFPVYVLFTKADLVSGFMEFFGECSEAERQAVWGATFQPVDRTRNPVGDAPAEFDELIRRLSQGLPDRLQEETDPAARIAAFGFPAQMACLRQRSIAFLEAVFGGDNPAGYVPRGFYFASGTQEGTPIDRILGAIGKSFGHDTSDQLSGTGKSFFLHDLLARVVFAEAGWVTRDRGADRRFRLVRHAAIGAVVLATLATLGVLGISFKANRDLVRATAEGAAAVRAAAAQRLEATTVADSDLATVLDGLEGIRGLPAGYDTTNQPASLRETLGMDQRSRLASASQEAYRQALERLLRPRLMLHLEQRILANLGDPTGLYELLKVYLMLGGKAPKADDEMIVAWMMRDWEQNRYPGPQNRDGRQALEKHLRAMLALDDAHDPSVDMDRSLVEAAQRSLGRMTVADRASALIAAAVSAKRPQDFAFVTAGGPETKLVFDMVDGSDLGSLRIPGIYTNSGFNNVFLAQLAGIAGRLTDDQWVVGTSTEQEEVVQELPRLGPDLLERYDREFAAAWNSALDRLKFQPMVADKAQFLALSAAGAPNSPIAQLFEAIARETALTRSGDPASTDPARSDGLAAIGIEMPGRKSNTRAGSAPASGTAVVPGASIEAQFRAFQLLVDGRPSQRPIDALVQNFRAIHQSLTIAAAAPTQADRVNTNLQLQISNLRANASRVPKALQRMILAAADEFEGDAARASLEQMRKSLAELVAAPCEEALANRYPFSAGSADDLPVADFTRLFGPAGLLDRYFAQNLAPYVDVSGENWSWKQGNSLGRDVSASALRPFQLAATIREAFFPLGGTTPVVNITVTPFSQHNDVDMALLNVNGQVVQSYQTGNSPVVIVWPGGTATGQASISLTPELAGRDSSISFEGPWALKRLLDTATTSAKDDKVELRFVIGGRDVAYTLQANSPGNPFSLPAFSAFVCPRTL
ncbi:type VI secretion system membrane subunit TssM [Aminobacter sp. HY435]|uniref:type VI secretion system membrane subunit TssM n=1 Tax=Aminobacter sp. HY435 TaxID=2970917 RepID=UPI0022B9CC4F|nr:type VI secretion system membrane subunit TssM [Aminobacter sp. HY435]